MIKEIKFRKCLREGANFEYVASLPGIDSLGGKITFKPGLNILIGPNGAGKSSILKVIGHHFAANHSGFSEITHKWLHQVNMDNGVPKSCADIVHDGQPIIFVDPKRALGLERTGSIDNEFYGQGMLELINSSSESEGEKSNRRTADFLEIMLGHAAFPEEFLDGIGLSGANNSTVEKVDLIAKNWFNAKIKKGQKTIILDEPESGLSFLNQILLWRNILNNEAVKNQFQIILVTHNIQSINVPGAHYIELKPGFLDACRKMEKGLLSDDDAASFASKLEVKLSKRAVSFLLSIRDGAPVMLGKSPKAADELLKVDFIATYSDRKASGFRGRHSAAVRHYYYRVTEKGLQFLNQNKLTKKERG